MLEPKEVNLSPMPKTWILDLDGTIVVHDGPYILGHDKFLPGAKEFLDGISEDDMIIFLTARGEWEKEHTLRFLKENHPPTNSIFGTPICCGSVIHRQGSPVAQNRVRVRIWPL